jgi:adenylate cyclase
MFGDGVNAAARMQSLAEPGCVCLSGTAHEFAHRVLAYAFEDLGLQYVKNLDTPIRAYLARPSDTPLAKAIPPVHRSREIHLVRRLHGILTNALMDVLKPEGLKPGDAPTLASIADAPGLNHRQLAERIGIDAEKTKRLVMRLKHLGIIERVPGGPRGESRGLSNLH